MCFAEGFAFEASELSVDIKVSDRVSSRHTPIRRWSRGYSRIIELDGGNVMAREENRYPYR